MSNLPEAQKLRLQAWAEQASSLGWIPASNVHALQEAALSNPGQLFEPSDRPLVAGLFGGTGVGKSTLLNRLAADAIAVASAERPTSRDITVYVHQSISVDNLPTSLPMQRMRTSLHRNEDYRNVMFIDMPDFDSVETANRELVDLWLPHLDVILYVVSPERYRDDKGWQLLKKHGSEHAWIFIINQWDRGVEQQRDDFVAQLAGQGLEQPMVFCTDCADARHALGSDLELATDDFAHLRQTLLNLSEQRIVTHLQELGVMARLATLKEMSDPWTEALGDEQLQLQLTTQWESHSEEHPGASAKITSEHHQQGNSGGRRTGVRAEHASIGKFTESIADKPRDTLAAKSTSTGWRSLSASTNRRIGLDQFSCHKRFCQRSK